MSEGEAASAVIKRLLSYRWLLLLAAGVFAADQLTKACIAARLPFGSYGPDGIVVVRGFLNWVHVGNTGAAWSLFSGRSVVLAALAAATLVAIFLARRALGLRAPGAQVSFGLLCGGIVGNLADRLRYGHVVDFIDVHFGSYVYPTFNLADSAICLGVALFLIQSLRSPDR